MASAEDVLVVLNLAERALDEVQIDPGEPSAGRLQFIIGVIRAEVSELKELATATEMPKLHPARELAVSSVLAAIGRLLPPSMKIPPAPAIIPQVEDLEASLGKLRTALSDPTTPPQ